ncbi:hypothetical protein [Acinetobacter pittii]|uniref:hypothetical protein n=1 Tax=Acinetobacter pittii TaxID=48296 RepID=UPI002A038886|nr:hypothetical protein [Acinetobacter pittii]MDX8253690.1 hypothetical protein [Acinetobacter pittii]
MPRYLIFAENIYKKVAEEKIFSSDIIENMNILMQLISSEISGTEFNLKYKFIDFRESFSKPLHECKVKIDVSLIPDHSLKDEYILWLAGFIEKITDGGPKPPPAIKKFIPEFYSVESDSELDFTLRDKKIKNKGEDKSSHFKSKLFKATYRK